MGRPRRDVDDVLIAALAAGMSRAASARHAGVSERTVRRRLQDAHFEQRVKDARGEAITAGVAQLVGLSPKAVATLDELLDTGTEPIRLRAAVAVLDLGPKLRAMTELTDRLEELERALLETQPEPPRRGHNRP